MLVVFAALTAVLLGIIGYRRRQFDREIEDTVESLLAGAESTGHDTEDSTDWAELPAPVRRYFDTALVDTDREIRTVRLRQRGEFRLGGRDAAWRPLEATQHVRVSPPGFVWDAQIDVLPLVPARVIDSYSDGDGTLEARLLSVLPVATAGPSDEMNEGELVRYLAEAVWYPTALLPANGVEWTGIDDRSAMATLEHDGTTASVVFHFDDNDEVSRVTTDRYRQEADAYAPWTGYFRNYENHDGRHVPTAATVEWNLPDGDLEYWRATVTELDYTDGE